MVINADVILCERCGYDLSALERRATRESAAPCPECGAPIAASVPERRAGTAWQAGAGAKAWARTGAAVLAGPRRVWGRVAASGPSGVGLCATNCALAGALWGMTVVLTGAALFPAVSWAEASGDAGKLAGVASVALFVMSAIERVGIGLFGRRRRWRITPAVAWAVVGHASYGWFALPALAVASLAAQWAASAWLGRPWPFACRVTGASWGVVYWAAHAAPILPAMLVFEALVYAGFRAMRFANHPRDLGRAVEASGR